jgi:hypothetical protein
VKLTWMLNISGRSHAHCHDCVHAVGARFAQPREAEADWSWSWSCWLLYTLEGANSVSSSLGDCMY